MKLKYPVLDIVAVLGIAAGVFSLVWILHYAFVVTVDSDMAALRAQHATAVQEYTYTCAKLGGIAARNPGTSAWECLGVTN